MLVKNELWTVGKEHVIKLMEKHNESNLLELMQSKANKVAGCMHNNPINGKILSQMSCHENKK